MHIIAINFLRIFFYQVVFENVIKFYFKLIFYHIRVKKEFLYFFFED